MASKNILLGRGEALTSTKKITRGYGGKKYPYTLEEIREALTPSLMSVQKSLSELPRAAKPRGEGVFELTLHPAFLARSYFPNNIFKKSGLRDVGSKETTIIPRKVTDDNDIGKEQATATIYVAGNESSVGRLLDIINSSSIAANLERELKEIESIRWIDNWLFAFKGVEKI